MGLRFASAVGAVAALVVAAPAVASTAVRARPGTAVRVVKGLHLGAVPRTPAVIGGAPAGTRYPSVVFIVGEDSGGSFACTGSKISSRWILTAAHCVSDETSDAVLAPDKLHVAIGNKPISTLVPGDFLTVAQVVRNPGWNKVALRGDVALLKLAAPVDTWSLELASLAREPKLAADGTVVGFGATAQAGPSTFTFPDVMQYGTTTIWSASVCNAQWGAQFDASTQVCAGRVAGVTPPPATTCSGDSGGPLLASDALGDWIVGATSFGAATCTDAPTVFSRVPAFLSWILRADVTNLAGPEQVTATKQVSGTETTATVSVTAVGRGADGLLLLGPDGKGNAYDGAWVRGEGPQTATLTATKLWPGTVYDIDVTGDSFYGATSTKRMSVETTDVHRPALRLARLVGHRGRRLAIRVHVSDNSPWFGYALKVLRGKRVVKRFSLGIANAPHTKGSLDRTVRWLVPAHARAGLKLCGHAVDGVGNLSRTVCKPIRLS